LRFEERGEIDPNRLRSPLSDKNDDIEEFGDGTGVCLEMHDMFSFTEKPPFSGAAVSRVRKGGD